VERGEKKQKQEQKLPLATTEGKKIAKAICKSRKKTFQEEKEKKREGTLSLFQMAVTFAFVV